MAAHSISLSHKGLHALCALILILCGAGCVAEPPAAPNAWLRPAATGPAEEIIDGWRLYTQGEVAPKIDGVAQRPGPEGLPLSGARDFRFEWGERSYAVPAQPDDPCAPLRFAVVGDGRASLLGVGSGAYRNAIIEEARAWDPRFVVDVGDLVYRGSAASEWRRYRSTLPSWPPIVAVRGNHDRGEGFLESGAGMPPVFSWALGALLLVGLDTEGPGPEVRARIAQLERHFERAGPRWKVLVMHRPVWSRGNHGSDERGLNAQLVPLLERHGVHLVLSGHDHNYERFCPMLGLGDARRCDEARGVIYVVSGGAATFTVPMPGLSRKVDEAVAAKDGDLAEVFSNAQHHLQIDVHPERLTLNAYRARAGNVRPPGRFDHVERVRPMPAACAGQGG